MPIAQGPKILSPQGVLEGLSCQDFFDFVFGIQNQRPGFTWPCLRRYWRGSTVNDRAFARDLLEPIP